MRLLLSIAVLATASVSAIAQTAPTPAPAVAPAPSPQPAPALAPPTTLAELKKNPGGLEQVGGDLREHYGNFPVSAVYRRETERVKISYLVNGETIFGYRLEFIQPGGATQLWEDSINQFVSSTFPQDRYRHEPGSVQGINDVYYRTDDVLNEKAYEEAKKAYAAAETLRLQQQSFGNTTPPVEKEGKEGPPVAAPHTPLSIADYQKRFPDTVAIEGTGGSVAGFEYASVGDMPIDSYYIRKAGDVALLVLVHRGTIIGYVAKLRSPGGNDSIWQKGADAGLKASFPDPAFSRTFVGNTSPYYFYRIVDKAASKAANEAYLAEEAGKMKALLGF